MSNDVSAHDHDPGRTAPGLGVADVYFILFRRKWFVLAGLVLGIAGAATVYKIRAPLYSSTAKIMLRGVRESQAIGTPLKNATPSGNPIVSEGEILTSLDVAREAGKEIGPARIVFDTSPENVEMAALYISRNLKVDLSPQLDVITLQSRHQSPDVAREMLEQVIKAYLKKHHKIHSSVGGPEDALSQQREHLRTSYTNAAKALKDLKASVGIYSLPEFKKANAAEESKLRQALFDAEADLAQLRATLNDLQLQKGSSTTTNRAAVKEKELPPNVARDYATLLATLERHEQIDRELSGRFTLTNPQVQANQERITHFKTQKAAMEAQYPALLRVPGVGVSGVPTLPAATADLSAQTAQIPGLQAKIGALTNQLAEVQDRAKRVEEVESRIIKLQEEIDLYQKQLKDIELALQQKQTDLIIGSSNIQSVQDPSMPFRDFMALYKKMAIVLAGGMGFGVALAFLIEMVFDRSLRRPKDVESIAGVPLFLSIPRLAAEAKPKSSSKEVARPAPAVRPEEEFRTFHDALRDRLVTHFEVNNLHHKPKMVAVTGCEHGSGVSSVASGLAASLSEIGEGNVLLVDMRGTGTAHAFFQGKRAVSMEEALEFEAGRNGHDTDNLPMVPAPAAEPKPKINSSVFGEFVPKLKASEYEYIIFDMPPVSQTSVTAKVTRFMDMVLMVVEEGKTSKEVAVRAAALLGESKATVATVLNKHRRYVPRWLLHELD